MTQTYLKKPKPRFALVLNDYQLLFLESVVGDEKLACEIALEEDTSMPQEYVELARKRVAVAFEILTKIDSMVEGVDSRSPKRFPRGSNHLKKPPEEDGLPK